MADTNPQTIFLMVQIFGGLAVLGSYAWGLMTHPDTRMDLWGGVTEKERLWYVPIMPTAAIGHLLTIWYLYFKVNPEGIDLPGGFGYHTFTILFAIYLLFAAVWMPMTFSALEGNHSIVPLMKISLVIVGVACALILACLIIIGPQTSGNLHWWVIFGMSGLVIQTLFIDAIFWSMRFNVS